MKNNSYTTFIIVLLFSILTNTSCKKDEKVTLTKQNSNIVANDPITSISIDKDGIATITTKLGREIKQNVLSKISRKDTFLSKLDVLQDTTTSKLPITKTFRIPIRIDVSPSFIGNETKALSSLSPSEMGNSVIAPWAVSLLDLLVIITT